MRRGRSLLVGLLAVVAVIVAGAWLSGIRAEVDEVERARQATGTDFTSEAIDVGDVTLHVVFAGPEDGEPVLLLHGFPETWWMWHRQMAALAAAGFRVAAPDLRGTNRSEKPPSPEQYRGADHEADAIGLLDALGWDRVLLAGHDVGGGIAWRLVFTHPERLRAAVIFNAAHPLAWAGARPQDDPETISWFRSFFQLPFLPELVGRAGGYALLGANLRGTARPGTFDGEPIEILKAAWARDGALSTMIHNYRAPFVPIEPLPEDGAPAVPVQLVWGRHDAFLPVKAAELSGAYLPEGAVTIVEDAGHWVLLEEPESTSALLVAQFAAAGP